MKVLVYGAGNIGSLYAALLRASGQDVSVLARGQRLAEIRDDGIQLEDFVTGRPMLERVHAVEELGADDHYDLVLVVLPKSSVSEVLPVLAANRSTPTVLFFGNNAAGPGEMVDALGRERVLLGFPGAAAVASHRTIRYLILSAKEQPTTIGELDGSHTERITAIADALEAAGFPVSISSNMDAWLKTHAIEILPTANALYMAGDAIQLAKNRDALVLMLRAIREGYRALSALGVPITPANRRLFQWLPEPVLLFIMKRMLADDATSIKIGHAFQARSEMKRLAAEIAELVEKSGAPAPSIETLNRYLDASAEPIVDTSAGMRAMLF